MRRGGAGAPGGPWKVSGPPSGSVDVDPSKPTVSGAGPLGLAGSVVMRAAGPLLVTVSV